MRRAAPDDPRASSAAREAGQRWRFGWRLRAALSLALLAGALLLFDVERLAAALQRMHPGWLSLSLLLQGAQLVLVAVRWHWLNRQLGLPLSLGRALVEYTLSNGINQLLPGGVAGDIARGYRQTRAAEQREHARVWLGVAADRVVGQLSLWLLASLAAPFWLPRGAGIDLGFAGSLLGVAAAVGLALWLWLSRRHPSLLRQLVHFSRRQLSPWILTGHLCLALALAACWVGSFYCASRSLSFTTNAPDVLRAALPALLASSLPGFVNGWGAREGIAALAYRSAGLPAAEGLAVSVAYGVVGLLLAALTLGALLPRLQGETGRRGLLVHGLCVLGSFAAWLTTGKLLVLLVGLSVSATTSALRYRRHSVDARAAGTAGLSSGPRVG